jgi:hypothetical protein
MVAVEETLLDIGRQYRQISMEFQLTNPQTILGVSECWSRTVQKEKTVSWLFIRGPQPGPVIGTNGAVTGWAGLIKVDGTSYTWMGAPLVNGVFPPSVTQESFEYTSSRSTFIMNVNGKVSMNVTFVNPTTPNDLRRQSVIGTYLYVAVASLDGATHNVQLYADTSAGTSYFPCTSIRRII